MKVPHIQGLGLPGFSERDALVQKMPDYHPEAGSRFKASPALLVK